MAHKVWYEQNTPEEQEAALREKQLRGLTASQPTFNDGHELAYKIASYVAMQRATEKPVTMAGVAIACGVTRKTLENWRKGSVDKRMREVEDKFREKVPNNAKPIYDYLIGGQHEGKKRIFLSEVVLQYDELAAMEREQRLYERGNVADIFALKAIDGWQDESKAASGVVNNTLVVTGDSADKALEMLGYKKLPGGK